MSLPRVISSAFEQIKFWNANRATRTALLKLTDRELADIGFVRGDVDTLA
ncbi:MAG: DUF1127 domain-containing protein [Paracoccaceae bacterium]|jgi:uncharacterized protein YjiS (DUF1127 family)